MLVYHTSDQRFVCPDVYHSRDALDFGKGFYVTRLREQAEKYAQRFLRAEKDAFLLTFEYIPDQDLRVKRFRLTMKNGLILYVIAEMEAMSISNMISLKEA